MGNTPKLTILFLTIIALVPAACQLPASRWRI
jgi:hypothetical protein